MEHIIKKVFLSLSLIAPLSIFAHGEKPEVVKGKATFENEGKSQIITADDKTVIHFTKFNLAPDEHTRFVQPDNRAAVLCRMTGKEPSKIRGHLEANGRLLFINPYGIVFSETAQVNVGTLIASTLNIKDDDFLADNYKFFLEPEALNSAVVNKGQITAQQQVVMMGAQVFNQGVITARAGKVQMLGGEMITLSFDSDDLISFAIDVPLKEGVIEQSGQIIAREVFVSLKTAQQLIKNVVNVNGIVEATSIKRENGVVRLVPKSSIEAESVAITGHSIESSGDLNVKGSLAMEAHDQIRWLKANSVGDLSLKADTVIVKENIDCAALDLQGTGLFQIGANINARNSKLIFDAPVSIMTNDLVLSPGDMGGDIFFQKSLNADPSFKNVRLSLDANKGDIVFHGPVGDLYPLESLTIVSAHNVSAQAINVGKFTQKAGGGTTRLEGVVTAPQGVDLNSDVLQVHANVNCDKGDFKTTVARSLNINQNAVVSAQSFQQKGVCNVSLSEDIRTSIGGISFDGNVQVNSIVELAPAGGKGTVAFNGKLTGSGDLSIKSSACSFMGDIGVEAPLSSLRVSCSGPITVHNIGNGKAGVNEVVDFSTPGTIYFKGTVYNAGPQHYSAGKGFDFLAGKPTECSSVQTVAFYGAPLFLSPGTHLSIVTSTGAITIPQVKASNCDLVVASRKNNVDIGKVEGADHLVLEGKKITLRGPIDVNDTVFAGPVAIEILEETFNVLAREGNIHFKSSCKGNVGLSLNAPKGRVILDGQLGGLVRGKEPRFKSINLSGKIIDQNEGVHSTGPIVYTASEKILLGGDANSINNDIVFHGPVVLDNTNAISITSGTVKGNVIFNSTLDADRPSRALVISNGKSSGAVLFKGDIGLNGPLGDLKVNSSRIELKNVGTANQSGVAKHLELTSEKAIELFGTTYNTGQQTWSAPSVSLKSEAATTFITNGLPMTFTGMTKLNLGPNTPVTLETRGGMLELSKLFGQHHQSVTITTGRGQAHLGEIEGILDGLHVQGHEIILSGRIDVGTVFMEANHQIRYKMTENTPVNKTSVLSRGDITLNAQEGMVGSFDYPIHVEAQGLLYVGAESFAYLEGTCSDGYPHVYAKNPAPRIFFNRNEYQYIVFPEVVEEEQLMSLAPDLSHKIPGGFIDGSTLKPRRAPIYYEAK